MKCRSSNRSTTLDRDLRGPYCLEISHWCKSRIHPRNLTWNLKSWFPNGRSFSRGLFSGSMLIFQGVSQTAALNSYHNTLSESTIQVSILPLGLGPRWQPVTTMREKNPEPKSYLSNMWLDTKTSWWLNQPISKI